MKEGKESEDQQRRGRPAPWRMGRGSTPLLTFLNICSLLDLGGRCLGSDLGQEGEEAEEQVGPPKLHAAAPAGAAAAACSGPGSESTSGCGLGCTS